MGINNIKELAIGTRITYHNKTYEVVKNPSNSCINCYFYDKHCSWNGINTKLGECSSDKRIDGNSIYFIKREK